MANWNFILLFNDFKTINSLNRNTNTALFSSDTNIILVLVFYITPKFTSLIYKYYKPLDFERYYPLIYGLKLHLNREHNID